MRFGSRLLAGLCVLTLPACVGVQMTDTEKEIAQTLGSEAFQPATRELRDSIETQDLLAQATFWSREYQLNPADLEATIKLASVVRKMGNPNQAVQITQTTRALYPKDPYLIAEYAAALIAADRGGEALPVLDGAVATTPTYARLWSLRGAALDQSERYAEARASYQKALSISPYDPNILANLGLSFALDGDTETAEMWLTRAASIPGASESVKTNLQLVQQLRGKTPTPATRQATAPVPQAMPQQSLPPTGTPQSGLAGAQPRGRFQLYQPGQAQSAMDAARQMSRTAPQTQPLQATDPNALDRLARNAATVPPTPYSQPPQQAQPQGYQQGYPPGNSQTYPQGYPQAQTPSSPFAPQAYAPAFAPTYPPAQSQPIQPSPQGYGTVPPSSTQRRGPLRPRR